MKPHSRKEKPFILWANLLDLGVASAMASLKKRKSYKSALTELRQSLRHQSEEHWKGLRGLLERLK